MRCSWLPLEPSSLTTDSRLPIWCSNSRPPNASLMIVCKLRDLKRGLQSKTWIMWLALCGSLLGEGCRCVHRSMHRCSENTRFRTFASVTDQALPLAFFPITSRSCTAPLSHQAVLQNRISTYHHGLRSPGAHPSFHHSDHTIPLDRSSPVRPSSTRKRS